MKKDVIVVGGGLAGIVTSLELLKAGKTVLILDRDKPEKFGGLAKWSFGGMFFVKSSLQKNRGIKDSEELALSDWHSFAEFNEHDEWPKKWAEYFITRSTPDVYDWLKPLGVGFFPIVHWVERGLLKPGNSVPRFHMVWGTGHWLAECLIQHLQPYIVSGQLEVKFNHKVEDVQVQSGRISGCLGQDEKTGNPFECNSDFVVIATGGICGNISKVKANWYKPWGNPPETILNGSHPVADGLLHEVSQNRLKAKVTHMDKYWHYAAGVHNPEPEFENHGLSIVPPKSALWLKYTGERFGPMPLMSAYDTRYLVEEICKQEKKYSWQLMNYKILLKEFAISGSEANAAIRDKKIIPFLKNVLFGNKKLVNKMMNSCVDFVVADTPEELVKKMNKLQGNDDVKLDNVLKAIHVFDGNIQRGSSYQNDEQLRRLDHLRKYKGDKSRLCKNQKIMDSGAMPLIAIREFILSRKSLGGIQTNLESQVLDEGGEVIPGYYAVGEASGFGGGGAHGLRALEGTFLVGCVLNGRQAAKNIISNS